MTSILIAFVFTSTLLAQAETSENEAPVETTSELSVEKSVEKNSEKPVETTVEKTTETVTQTEDHWVVPDRDRYEEIIDYDTDTSRIPGPPGRLDDVVTTTTSATTDNSITTAEETVAIAQTPAVTASRTVSSTQTVIQQQQQSVRSLDWDQLAKRYFPQFYRQERVGVAVLSQFVYQQPVAPAIYDAVWAVVWSMIQ
ncbi:hypothetical protein IU402_00550 [Aerococcaceae bacterium zg-BR9]|uniref:hypothetical protein n=1 Tax=Aerococcaceae bacterium zg-1292 TaxID=2774330 RepID=UPI004064334B|nr:hypothetical protein [Aerococcaceae bacterium zg-BR9]